MNQAGFQILNDTSTNVKVLPTPTSTFPSPVPRPIRTPILAISGDIQNKTPDNPKIDTARAGRGWGG